MNTPTTSAVAEMIAGHLNGIYNGSTGWDVLANAEQAALLGSVLDEAHAPGGAHAR